MLIYLNGENMKRKLFLTISLFLIMIMITPATIHADQLADIKAAGKMIVGSDTTYAPFEFLNSSGKAVGFDVSLGNAIGQKMGVSVEFKTVVWDTIIPSLNSKQFDVIISAMTITADRAKLVDFSIPYYNSSQAILVQNGNPKGIHTTDDLKTKNVKIGVQTGTTSDIFISKLLGNTSTNIVRLKNFSDLYLKLDTKEIDVILGDLPVIGYAASTGAVKGEVVAKFGSVEQFGIAVRKGETTLLNAINDALKSLLAGGANSEYNKIAAQWFAPIKSSSAPAPVNEFSLFFGLAFVTFIFIKKRKSLKL